MANLFIILKDRYISSFFILSLIILLGAFLFVYFNLADSAGLLVIHFDSYRGADFFGNRIDVFNILSISAIVFMINIILAGRFYFRERFLSYFIVGFNLIFAALILIAVNVIISIN